MNTPNKQHDKTLNGVKPTPVQQKQRPGTDPKQPSNADYDYRPDFGVTGGGVDHNPELNTDTIQNPAQKPADKPKRKK
jgi:hypothetical protein